MCGRVIQSSGPLRYAIVDGMNFLRDSRVHNYPPRWNAAPSRHCWLFDAIIRPAKSPSIRCGGGLFPTGAKTPRADASRSTPNARR